MKIIYFIFFSPKIQETPLPHAYETTNYSFLTDIMKKPGTYRFKSDGRKLNPTPQIGKGEALLPGAYDFEDMTTRYCFRTNCFKELFHI